MKIRSLELYNFRKFTGRFRVDGIGDGLNVLVGPNEHGKSTLLAAINGVIFEKATSQNERVEGFRHFTNGVVPVVDLAFDLDNVRWTIQKRFARQSGRAVLTNQNGRRFESEEAEAELQHLLGFERPSRNAEPGIWGTLWVQQGKSFGDATLDEPARRSLEDCLEAQVGMVTGGQRGQRIPAAIENALLDIQTKATRAPRSKFKEAVDKLTQARRQVAEHEKKRDELAAQTEELGRLRRERQRARADWDEPAHRQLLHELHERRMAAATRAAEVDAARKEAELAADRAKQAQKVIDERKSLRDELASLETQTGTAAIELEQAEVRKDEVQVRVDCLERQLSLLRERQRRSGETLRRLERVRGALTLADEIRHHEDTLAKAAQLRDEIGRLSEAIGANPATEEKVSRAEDAGGELAAANAAVGAVATALTFALDPGAAARVHLDGEALAGPSVTVFAVTKRTVAIDGIGEIAIEPQIADREMLVERVRRVEADLAAALELVGAGDLSAARRARAERLELVRQLESRQREIGALAPADRGRKLPAGLAARETRIRELRGRLDAECASLGLTSLPQPEDLAQEISDANQKGEQISTQIDQTVAALEGPKRVLAEAAETVKNLDRHSLGLNARLDERRTRLAAGRRLRDDDELTRHAAEQQHLAENAAGALAARELAEGEKVEEIDLRIKRLEAFGRQRVEEIVLLDKRIAVLEKEIEINEGAGAEEARDTAHAEAERLQRIVEVYKEDAKVLELLRDTLRDCEREAKQRYLTPIAQRTEPYLRMLLPDARLRFSEKLSIEGVERRGATEEFGYLSAGTQEQLAVLTRLAFAELLLAKGHPATVILDDALVFSDDDRIERMFDILMRAAEKVQILILTCRQRLFARLGGSPLQIVECREVN